MKKTKKITIFTIGFTGKTAREFFESLRAAKVKRLLDIRLNNTSQLAAFAKKADLEYFLGAILKAEYIHVPALAPTRELLDQYRESKNWELYEIEYMKHIEKMDSLALIDYSLFDRDVVLLCSEDKPDRCHRRLAAEFLAGKLNAAGIVHL